MPKESNLNRSIVSSCMHLTSHPNAVAVAGTLINSLQPQFHASAIHIYYIPIIHYPFLISSTIFLHKKSWIFLHTTI